MFACIPIYINDNKKQLQGTESSYLKHIPSHNVYQIPFRIRT